MVAVVSEESVASMLSVEVLAGDHIKTLITTHKILRIQYPVDMSNLNFAKL